MTKPTLGSRLGEISARLMLEVFRLEAMPTTSDELADLEVQETARQLLRLALVLRGLRRPATATEAAIVGVALYSRESLREPAPLPSSLAPPPLDPEAHELGVLVLTLGLFGPAPLSAEERGTGRAALAAVSRRAEHILALARAVEGGPAANVCHRIAAAIDAEDDEGLAQAVTDGMRIVGVAAR